MWRPATFVLSALAVLVTVTACRRHAVVQDEPVVHVDPLRRLVEPTSVAYIERPGRELLHVAVHCSLDDKGVWSCQWGESEAKRVEGVQPASQLVAGHSFVCALERRGRLACIYTNTVTVTASIIALPFRVRHIAGNEQSVILEAEDGRVHECQLPYGTEEPPRACALTPLDVPDVDAYVNSGLHRCSLDRNRRPSCRGMASENSDGEEPIAVPGFPTRVRRLVEGLGSYETGAVVCAIGAVGELACYRSLRGGAHDEAIANVEPIALPGPVRDLSIGSSYGRAVLEDGSVYEIPMSLTRGYPPAARLFVPILVPTSEPADAISANACIRYRSGRVDCATKR